MRLSPKIAETLILSLRRSFPCPVRISDVFLGVCRVLCTNFFRGGRKRLLDAILGAGFKPRGYN